MDGGGNGAAATPIYNYFVNISRKFTPHYISFIMPARWYGGGRGLDDFRVDMLNETHISFIKDFPNPKDCFPSANISGGVCYFLWDKYHNSNVCTFVNSINGVDYLANRKLNEFEIFLRYNNAISIVHKVLRHNDSSLSELVSQYMPFGIRSYVRGTSKNSLIQT